VMIVMIVMIVMGCSAVAHVSCFERL
jgi:hypothetical protein